MRKYGKIAFFCDKKAEIFFHLLFMRYICWYILNNL